MGRTGKTSAVWNHFRVVSGKGPNRDKTIYACKYCGLTYAKKNATKKMAHLLKCLKMPNEKKKELEKGRSRQSNIESSDDEGSDDDLMSMRSGSPRSSYSADSSFGTPSSSRASSAASSSSHQKKVKGPIESFFDSMGDNQEKIAVEKMARAMYVTGVPLGMFEHELWKDFFKYLRPSFSLPSRRALSTAYLDSEYTRIETQVTHEISNSTDLHLQCDGWSNIRNQGIINFVITTTKKPVFARLVDTEDNRHTGKYLAEQVQEVLDLHGVEKYLVLMGDNAKNIQNAFNIVVENNRPRGHLLVALGCLDHTLHLFCRDFLDTDTARAFMNRAVAIVNAVKNSQILSAALTKIKSDHISLKLPGKTRWSSNLFCLESLLSNKRSLQQLVVSDGVEDAMKNLKAEKSDILDDDIFWVRVQTTVEFLKPISRTILELEGDKNLIHRVYPLFKDLEENIERLLPLSILTAAEEKKIHAKFQNRKANAVKPIHLAACLLNPHSQGSECTSVEIIDAMEFISDLADKMPVNESQAMAELAGYRSKRDGVWGKPFLWKCLNDEAGRKMSPIDWWTGFLGNTELSKVACRILSAPASSAATERTFSRFSWIHSKKKKPANVGKGGKNNVHWPQLLHPQRHCGINQQRAAH